MVSTAWEKWRISTLYTKEPGTVAWIKAEVQPDDVFYDVGANIGCYTLLAAKRLGPTGHVIAFEPHIGSAASLLANASANGLQPKITLLTCALHDESTFLTFNYQHTGAGSSASQLGHTRTETGEEFAPAATELKYGVTVDSLVAAGALPDPTLVKIDVDGNELLVLHGMEKTLLRHCIRSLQVECHPDTSASIVSFLDYTGYTQTSVHHTALGADAIAKGSNPDKVFCNRIFHKV